MKALVVGNKKRYEELLLKLPSTVSTKHYNYWEIAEGNDYDLIFDLNFDDFVHNLDYIAQRIDIPVFVCAVKKRLAEAVHDFGEIQCNLIGMNCLPGFINRELIEISLFKNNPAAIESILQQLGWTYKIVEDRAGMVTPRIICMIINEACFTLQEGTASMNDIDLSMKLGTNYPHGPFEWADKIGIKDVYETLDALYNDTRDERYKICPLLKTKYLNRENFY